MASALERVRCLRSRVASNPPTKASHKVSCARYEAAPGMEKLPSGRPMASMSGRSIESRNATMSAPFSMLLSDVRNRFGEEDSATDSNLPQERHVLTSNSFEPAGAPSTVISTLYLPFAQALGLDMWNS